MPPKAGPVTPIATRTRSHHPNLVAPLPPSTRPRASPTVGTNASPSRPSASARSSPNTPTRRPASRPSDRSSSLSSTSDTDDSAQTSSQRSSPGSSHASTSPNTSGDSSQRSSHGSSDNSSHASSHISPNGSSQGSHRASSPGSSHDSAPDSSQGTSRDLSRSPSSGISFYSSNTSTQSVEPLNIPSGRLYVFLTILFHRLLGAYQHNGPILARVVAITVICYLVWTALYLYSGVPYQDIKLMLPPRDAIHFLIRQTHIVFRVYLFCRTFRHLFTLHPPYLLSFSPLPAPPLGPYEAWKDYMHSNPTYETNDCLRPGQTLDSLLPPSNPSASAPGSSDPDPLDLALHAKWLSLPPVGRASRKQWTDLANDNAADFQMHYDDAQAINKANALENTRRYRLFYISLFGDLVRWVLWLLAPHAVVWTLADHSAMLVVLGHMVMAVEVLTFYFRLPPRRPQTLRRNVLVYAPGAEPSYLVATAHNTGTFVLVLYFASVVLIRELGVRVVPVASRTGSIGWLWMRWRTERDEAGIWGPYAGPPIRWFREWYEKYAR